MSRLQCPHCGLRALSAWRKLALGPAGRARCRSCGLRVGVAPVQALLAMLPSVLVVLAVLTGIVRQPGLAVGAALLGIACTALAHQRIPLVRRQLTDRAAVQRARELHVER
ncbi:hypothetical protein [Aquincola sp. J276]|uniref:hypothetical protein n=1 Tax=Aquincola sp. J276 TaxID=2898432 RepID=UPI002151EC97|nr:hypothetical protein [Aquincola sp. J276]MCR5867105.1 hypothetical protein [Aquincola sp. J276]